MTTPHTAVAAAWAARLPAAAGRFDLGFAEAGGDSLMALALVHDLGLALGVDLPLDVLGPDDTQDNLASRVRAFLAGTLAGPGPAPVRQAPALVLVTGAYGDEPALANLRRRLAGAAVTTVEPAGIRAADGMLRSMREMASVVASAVPASDSVHLAGFSFGGPLAAEAAYMLERAGRGVASLSLLDAPYSREAMRLNLWEGRGLAERLSWAVQSAPGRWRPARVAVAAALPRLLPARDLGHAMRRRLLDPSRRRALSGWRPRLPDVPTLVVLGDGLGEANAADWARAAPAARMLRVGGGHGDVLRGANLDAVADAVSAMLARAA